MTSEARTRKQSEYTCGSPEDWERAKEHWNEFSQKFNARLNESRVWGQRADKHMVEIKLPNGRDFSFTLGHLILFGLALWLLPFNLIVLMGLIWLAVKFGNDNSDPRKRHDEADKPKRKTDEDVEDFEIYKV